MMLETDVDCLMSVPGHWLLLSKKYKLKNSLHANFKIYLVGVWVLISSAMHTVMAKLGGHMQLLKHLASSNVK